ncbi:MAG: hypothetical protein P0S96_02225 [Simkaniaceae bacterium]|nr:hypothetical protein [Candidatus Sacchlamyda saccharinae]
MKQLDFNMLEQALDALGELLADREQFCEVVAIGGGSLLFLGQIARPTRDLDLVALIESGEFISAKPLPNFLSQAIRDVGMAMELGDEWVNAGPASLLEMGLPQGFKNRTQKRSFGALIVYFAGRFDQICFKLYAAVDQGPDSKHFADLKLLDPSREELQEAKLWCVTQDISKEFASLIDEVLVVMEQVNAKP